MSRTKHLAIFGILGLFVLSGLGMTLGGNASAMSHVVIEKTSVAGGSGGCPSSNAIANFMESTLVGASVGMGASTWTYFFNSLVNLNPSNGVPGLIQYCVYPNGSLPNSLTAMAVGADGSSFTTALGTHQGYLAFGRSHGDPSNVPLDGNHHVTMGTATWTSSVPTTQAILLHINDASECQRLYGGSSSTCFVYPQISINQSCSGQPACKVAAIAEASPSDPLTVPANTVLHIRFTITVVNDATNSFDMEFLPLTLPANASWTGIRDTFTCFQVLNPNGTPGANGGFPNYEGSGLKLLMSTGNPTPACLLPRLQMYAPGAAVILHPGDTLAITIDMMTTGGLSSNGGPEHGLYCLNKGATVRWYETDDAMIHSFHTADVDIAVA